MEFLNFNIKYTKTKGFYSLTNNSDNISNNQTPLIDKSIEIQLSDDFISRLPVDIKKHIFDTYINKDLILREFDSILYSEDFARGNIDELYEFIKNILFQEKNNDVLNYLLINNELFRADYYHHFVLKKNLFIRVQDPITSFAMAMWYSIYH